MTGGGGGAKGATGGGGGGGATDAVIPFDINGEGGAAMDVGTGERSGDGIEGEAVVMTGGGRVEALRGGEETVVESGCASSAAGGGGGATRLGAGMSIKGSFETFETDFLLDFLSSDFDFLSFDFRSFRVSTTSAAVAVAAVASPVSIRGFES